MKITMEIDEKKIEELVDARFKEKLEEMEAHNGRCFKNYHRRLTEIEEAIQMPSEAKA